MTAALDAMVKAMAAALWAQINTHDWDPADVELLHEVDLEKVARAGLVAIREPDIDLILAGALMEDSVGVWWPRLIDKILEEPS